MICWFLQFFFNSEWLWEIAIIVDVVICYYHEIFFASFLRSSNQLKDLVTKNPNPVAEILVWKTEILALKS